MQFCVSTLSTHLAKANPAGDPSGCACRPDTLGQGSAPVLIVPTRQGWKGPVVMFPEGAWTNGSAILVPRGRRIFSWCRDWNLSRGNCDGEGGVFFLNWRLLLKKSSSPPSSCPCLLGWKCFFCSHCHEWTRGPSRFNCGHRPGNLEASRAWKRWTSGVHPVEPLEKRSSWVTFLPYSHPIFIAIIAHLGHKYGHTFGDTLW